MPARALGRAAPSSADVKVSKYKVWCMPVSGGSVSFVTVFFVQRCDPECSTPGSGSGRVRGGIQAAWIGW